MTESDKPQFLAILNGLAAVKPGAKLTREAYAMWWLAMRGWELEDFRDAAAHLVRTCEFMPNPFHFEQLRNAARTTAPEAWLIAKGHANCAGAVSGDDLIDRTVRAIGGYELLYLTPLEKLGFLERRFCEHYETLQAAQSVRESLPSIAPARALAGEVPKITLTWPDVAAIAKSIARREVTPEQVREFIGRKPA